MASGIVLVSECSGRGTLWLWLGTPGRQVRREQRGDEVGLVLGERRHGRAEAVTRLADLFDGAADGHAGLSAGRPLPVTAQVTILPGGYR